MPTCAFVTCAEATVPCPLAGGCVVERFAHVPKYHERATLLTAGLKKNARKGTGPAKGKQPKRR